MSGRPGGLSEMIAKQLMRGMKAEDPVGGATARPDARASVDGLARALWAQEAPRGEDDEPSMFPSGAQMAAAAAARARVAAAAAAPESGRTVPQTPAAAPESGRTVPQTPAAGARPGSGGIAGMTAPTLDGRRGAAQSAFVDRMWHAAAAAERSTGVPAGFIVGQAALETGWGRAEIRHADGRSAHNLFGIKAGPGWRGETVEATTTEFVDGRAVKTVERFRAYGSYEASFADWARLMASNPRYAGVLQAGGSIESFSRNLQKAGYATDPDYASKLTRTITQALTLRREST
jgi:flagellar protein FlgJ